MTRSRKKRPTGNILQVKITLSGAEIWRRVLIEGDATMDEVHEIIQTAMGWENDHVHEFVKRGRSLGAVSPLGDVMRDADGPGEADVGLGEVLRHVGSKARYLYDFGDGWEHDILLEKRLPAAPGAEYPLCVGGERACPPEDCGGLGGYYRILEAVKNPDSDEYGDLLEWVGEDYDPETFSPEAVNRRFRGEPEEFKREEIKADEDDEDEPA